MPYRDLDDLQRRRLDARVALERLAERGRECSERCERPRRPPPAARRPARPFPVEEDPYSPVAPYPGMTNDLDIAVEVGPLAASDVALVRDAVRSLHPLFDTRSHDAHLTIEIPSSKIEEPPGWIRAVIETVLPVLHAVHPIRSVRYGRRGRSLTR